MSSDQLVVICPVPCPAVEGSARARLGEHDCVEPRPNRRSQVNGEQPLPEDWETPACPFRWSPAKFPGAAVGGVRSVARVAACTYTHGSCERVPRMLRFEPPGRRLADGCDGFRAATGRSGGSRRSHDTLDRLGAPWSHVGCESTRPLAMRLTSSLAAVSHPHSPPVGACRSRAQHPNHLALVRRSVARGGPLRVHFLHQGPSSGSGCMYRHDWGGGIQDNARCSYSAILVVRSAIRNAHRATPRGRPDPDPKWLT